MAKLYYDADADLARLKGKTVAIIGYGSQGHAHALNLRDSGVDVVVGLPEGSRPREGAGRGAARDDVADAAKAAQFVMILAPDRQVRLYEGIAANLSPGDTLMFARVQRPFGQSNLRPASTSGWSRPRRPVTVSARCSPRARHSGLVAITGRERQSARQRARLRQGHRLHARRRHRDHVRRGDRDRPLR